MQKNPVIEPRTGVIMTVTGAIDPSALGVTLPHEHVMSTFGAESARYPTYDIGKLKGSVLPYLARIKGYGCQTVVDCTATHFGRHPELLQQISQESGLYILTNTGYYGAAQDRYVPQHAFEENADQIAARWVREWRFSIDDTGIYPGFIKTALDDGPVSDIDRKLVLAAARTHLQTGLTIQTHVGNNWEAVQEVLSILLQEGIHPSTWIWVHANQVQDFRVLVKAAQQGVWISLDGVNPDSAVHILTLIAQLKDSGCLGNVLVSHDGDSYFSEGDFRAYHYLFSDFIPQLIRAGFTDGEIRTLTVENPRKAFTVGIRANPA